MGSGHHLRFRRIADIMDDLESQQRHQPRMHRKEALKLTFAWPSVRRALTVAVLVGTALNFINQGDVLLNGAELVWWKLLLTYFVPFAVASYGGYAALQSGR